MDAGNRSFSDFVTGKHKFEVPDYQRNFSWSRDHLSDLWRDLHNSLETGKDHYFGTFLLMERGGQQVYDIIDGQQRLTSIVILLNELTEKWRAYDEEEALDTRDWYIASRNGFKLNLMGDDRRFFKEYVLGGLDEEEEQDAYPEETRTPSQVRLKEAKSFFNEKLSDVEEGRESHGFGDFQTYCAALKERVESLDLMVYPVESEEDAVRIFEVVNDRGKHLTDLEKTKSFLMHQLYLSIPDDDEELLKERLEEVRNRFGDIYRLTDEINANENAQGLGEDRVQRYHYILWDTEWTTSRDKRYYQNHLDHLKQTFRGTPSDQVVSEILRYTRDLRNSFHAVRDLIYRRSDDREIRKRLERLFVLGRLANFYPLLIASWLKYDKDSEYGREEFIRILDRIETFIFRVYSAQQRPGNTGRTRFYPLGRDVHQGNIGAGKAASKLADYIHTYCDDSQLRDILEDASVYTHYSNRKSELRYLLYFYEKHLEEGLEELPFDLTEFVKNEADEEITIEHIWPRNPEKLGLSEEELEIHEAYKHHLGNLALMTGPWNSGQSNQPFSKKRDTYASSKIRMLNKVAEQPSWGPEEIEKREDEMLSFILDQWEDAKTSAKLIQ